jgi:hypothetical protein
MITKLMFGKTKSQRLSGVVLGPLAAEKRSRALPRTVRSLENFERKDMQGWC